MAMILLVNGPEKRSKQSIKTKANQDEGKVDLKTEASIVVKRSTEDSSSNSFPLQDSHLLMPGSPRSPSSSTTMPVTKSVTFGFKTGEDLDVYLEKAIANEDVDALGVYNKDADDVNLKLCLQGCGGPLLGHITNTATGLCERISEKKYEELKDDELARLIDDIKHLPNWNDAKLMWINEPGKCKCDQCDKTLPTLFHLKDHMKVEHRTLDTIINKKINEKKFSKPESSKTIEEAVKALLDSQGLFLNSMIKNDTSKENKQIHVQKPEFVPEWTKFQKYETFKENLKNWDLEHQTLSDSNKFGKLISSLTKNKEITDLAKLASGKISETLMNIKDKNVDMIIEMLDEKYLQTRSEKYEVLSYELENFKLGISLKWPLLNWLSMTI